MPELRRSTDPPPDPPSCASSLLLLHSVMQFKYFSEALLARLGADFPSQYQLEIVHYTSLGAGKELESFLLHMHTWILDINTVALLGILAAAAAVVGAGPRSVLYK